MVVISGKIHSFSKKNIDISKYEDHLSKKYGKQPNKWYINRYNQYEKTKHMKLKCESIAKHMADIAQIKYTYQSC